MKIVVISRLSKAAHAGTRHEALEIKVSFSYLDVNPFNDKYLGKHGDLL